jgi:hypothetical protein
MAFIRALADATLPSVLVALLTFVVADASGTVPPVALGPLAGAATLICGTAISHAFQTESRRYPLTWVALELLSFP